MPATLELLDVQDGSGANVVLPVEGYVGEEAMSELFWFRIAVVAPVHDDGDGAEADALARRILGTRAALMIGHVPPGGDKIDVAQTRYGMLANVHGVRVVGTGDARMFRVDCMFVPRAYRAALRKRSRIWSRKFVHEVASAVLSEHGLPHRWDLGRGYARRQYCVQYQETDLAFVKRILAEEGIAFFFEHRSMTTDGFGGAAAEVPEESDTLEGIASVGGAAAGLTSFIGDVASSGTVQAVGGVGALAADALRGPERDPDEIEEISSTSRPRFLAGSAGPAGGFGDVFCFVDSERGYVRTYPGDTPPPAGDDTPSVVLLQEDTSGLRNDGLDAFDFIATRRVASEIVLLRDHDFRKPMLDVRALSSRAITYDVGDPPPTIFPLVGFVGSRPPGWVYEHHGEYDPPYVTPETAAMRLEQLQADVHSASGRSLCPRPMPGHLFRLRTNPPAPGESPPSLVNDADYVSVRVRHECGATAWVSEEMLSWDLAYHIGRTPDDDGLPNAGAVFHRLPRSIEPRCQLESVAAGVIYRPKPPPRRPRATWETAIVVGPLGKEIHTDKLGRVKVQFHWDTEGRWNDLSCCFLRVSQPWAGAGYGFQFLPRIGMEVLVGFIGGDPDRPVITGCLYDGTHPTPEPLTERATRSAIRTQSSPGGGGFNEIVFEDDREHEVLAIRAQRTLEEAAKGSHAVTVGDDQRVSVGNAQQIGVAGEQIVTVGKKRTVQVGGDRSETVGGNATTAVAQNLHERVEGSTMRVVGGAEVGVAKFDDLRLVGGSRSVTVRGNAVTHVGGREENEGNAVAFVHGDTYLTGEGSVFVRGANAGGDHPSKIRLSVGESYIEIGPHDVMIHAEHVNVVGTSSLTVSGNGHALVCDDSGGALTASPATVQNSAGTSMTLDGGRAQFQAAQAAEIHAAQIRLQSGGGSPESPATSNQDPAHQENNVTIEFTHQNFRRQANYPYPPPSSDSEDSLFDVDKLDGVPCRITYKGTAVKDTSDHLLRTSNGVLAFHVPDGVHEVEIALLVHEVDDDEKKQAWKALYPDTPPMFLVKLVEDFPAADETEGKRLRLRNLGYAAGLKKLESGKIDRQTERAIDDFRERQGLDELAEDEVAEATVTRLQRLYGDS